LLLTMLRDWRARLEMGRMERLNIGDRRDFVRGSYDLGEETGLRGGSGSGIG
jgi:hypothetical protein